MSACKSCGFTEGHHRPNCARVAAHPKAPIETGDVGTMPEIKDPIAPEFIPDDKRKIFEETIEKSPILQQIIAEQVAAAMLTHHRQEDAVIATPSPSSTADPLRLIHEGDQPEPLHRIAEALEKIAIVLDETETRRIHAARQRSRVQ